MINKEQAIDKLILTTISAVQLWSGEVSGQIGDGKWENSRPHNHYIFWCRLNVELGATNCVVRNRSYWNHGPVKNNYGIVGLMNLKWTRDDLVNSSDPYILRGRMIKMARMAKAFARVLESEEAYASRHMPETLQQAQDGLFLNMYDCTKRHLPFLTNVDVIEKYYATTYDKNDLRADLQRIQDGMRNIITFEQYKSESPSTTEVNLSITP
jgi:hypothetical protein